jgi:hypothetical protein
LRGIQERWQRVGIAGDGRAQAPSEPLAIKRACCVSAKGRNGPARNVSIGFAIT